MLVFAWNLVTEWSANVDTTLFGSVLNAKNGNDSDTIYTPLTTNVPGLHYLPRHGMSLEPKASKRKWLQTRPRTLLTLSSFAHHRSARAIIPPSPSPNMFLVSATRSWHILYFINYTQVAISTNHTRSANDGA